MKEIDFGFMENILGFCCFASENDMETTIRQSCVEFANKAHTAAELYDFLEGVSKIQCDRMVIGGKNICVGYISGFIQATCNLSRFYKRPDDGGGSQTIPQSILDHWKNPKQETVYNI